MLQFCQFKLETKYNSCELKWMFCDFETAAMALVENRQSSNANLATSLSFSLAFSIPIFDDGGGCFSLGQIIWWFHSNGSHLSNPIMEKGYIRFV